METNNQQDANQNNNPPEPGQIGSLNTMQGDYAHAVRNDNKNLADVALEAEARRRRVQYGTDKNIVRVQEKSHTTLYSIAIFILLAASLALIGYKVFLAPKPAPDPFAKFAVPTLIVPNEQIGVSGYEFRRGFEDVITDLAIKTPVKENEIVHVYFTDAEIRKLRTIDEENPVEIVDISTLLTLLSQDVPGGLMRALDQNNYTYGIYGLPDNERSQFLLLKTSGYENSFAGMLEWEKTMADDLQLLLQVDAQDNLQYIDRLFFNKDIRSIETSRGKTILLYSFIDTNTILITKDTSVFKDLLTRYYQSPILN